MDTLANKRVVQERARQSLICFVMLGFEFLNPGEPPLNPAWYLKAMCWWLERVAAGQLLRSMIWLMPRSLKSITAAVAFPCWVIGRDPSAKIMIVTYADKLSTDHADYRRQILESDWYRQLFPTTQIRISRQHEIKTEAHGQVLAVSVLGTITGRGADIIIMDDCMRAGDQDSEAAREGLKNWFTNTLATRLNDKRTGAIVSIQQRLHEDDLPAFMLERGFELLRLPAIADRDVEVEIGQGQVHLFKRNDLLDPTRFDNDVLERERLQLGPRHFSAQYLQEPTTPEGDVIRMHQLFRFDKPIPMERFERVFQSWDTAASTEPTAAYSVCTTWGFLAGRIFLLDIYRKRVDMPSLRDAAIALERRWRPNHVVIEHASSGIGLIAELKRINVFKVRPWRPSTGKVHRAIAQSGQIEEGRVWLPAKLEGLETFLSELRSFPQSKYCDQVDSFVQALEFINHGWHVLAQDYTSSGRPVRSLREGRPAFPPLPAFLQRYVTQLPASSRPAAVAVR